MRKAFYIVVDTTQADAQCIIELERAVGEFTSIRPEITKITSTDFCEICGADLSPNHSLKNDTQTDS